MNKSQLYQVYASLSLNEMCQCEKLGEVCEKLNLIVNGDVHVVFFFLSFRRHFQLILRNYSGMLTTTCMIFACSKLSKAMLFNDGAHK
jgi:hypothetical protein